MIAPGVHHGDALALAILLQLVQALPQHSPIYGVMVVLVHEPPLWAMIYSDWANMANMAGSV